MYSNKLIAGYQSGIAPQPLPAFPSSVAGYCGGGRSIKLPAFVKTTAGQVGAFPFPFYRDVLSRRLVGSTRPSKLEKHSLKLEERRWKLRAKTDHTCCPAETGSLLHFNKFASYSCEGEQSGKTVSLKQKIPVYT